VTRCRLRRTNRSTRSLQVNGKTRRAVGKLVMPWTQVFIRQAHLLLLPARDRTRLGSTFWLFWCSSSDASAAGVAASWRQVISVKIDWHDLLEAMEQLNSFRASLCGSSLASNCLASSLRLVPGFLASILLFSYQNLSKRLQTERASDAHGRQQAPKPDSGSGLLRQRD
jgi:hypothetical protein